MTPSIDAKKQARLIKSIALNVFVLMLFWVLALFYIIPSYEEITVKQAELSALNSEFLSTKNSWVTVAQYEALIARYAGIKKTGTLTPEDKLLTESALKKEWSAEGDYLEWLKTELKKESSIDKEIEINNRIITSIIPTYSEVDNSKTDAFTKNQISLGNLNEFVEQVLLKKNSLESFSPIGFGGISFENKVNSVLNIGSYKIPLDVRWKNKNILAFIDAVQTSWSLSIRDGKLVESANAILGSGATTSRFNNLLITFDTLTINDSLEDPEKENSMNATLVFYVRARGYNDLVAIRTKMSEGIKKLNTDITAIIDTCTNTSKIICKNEGVIRAIQTVKSFKNDAEELDKKMTERLKSTAISDLGGEFSAIFDIGMSYKNLATQVLVYSTQIETLNKQLTK